MRRVILLLVLAAVVASGNPASLVPRGSIIAGCPVRLNHTVNGENVNTRRQYSATSSSIMSIQPSFTAGAASPGVSSTSYVAWNAAIWRPRRCAGSACRCARSRPRRRSCLVRLATQMTP